MPIKTDFQQFEMEVGIWALNNWGPRVKIVDSVKYAHQPLLGIVEELGELYDAMPPLILAHNTVERHSPLLKDVIDAIGDVMVYMADYCINMSIPLMRVCTIPTHCDIKSEAILSIIGKLCHAHLKLEQNIRGSKSEHLRVIEKLLWDTYCVLYNIAYAYNLDFDRCISDTWAKVSKRDWKKNSINGGIIENV